MKTTGQKVGPTQFQEEVERLKKAGEFPTLDEVLSAVADARKNYASRIIAAREEGVDESDA